MRSQVQSLDRLPQLSDTFWLPLSGFCLGSDLGRSQPVGRRLGDVARELLLEPGHAQHEELVRFEATMARNLSRSTSGTVASRASSSTRSLNPSHDSSRLMNSFAFAGSLTTAGLGTVFLRVRLATFPSF
jgi:hypothetical protein